MGLGMGIALSCDIRMASERTPVCPRPSSGAGSFPADGSCWQLPRMIGLTNTMLLQYTGKCPRRRGVPPAGNSQRDRRTRRPYGDDARSRAPHSRRPHLLDGANQAARAGIAPRGLRRKPAPGRPPRRASPAAPKTTRRASEPSSKSASPATRAVSVRRKTRRMKRAIFSPDRRYRYLLRRRVGESNRRALFIMLNPSAADERDDDPTIRRCIGFARDWGYGILESGEPLRPWYPPNPRALTSARDPVGPRNDSHDTRRHEASRRHHPGMGQPRPAPPRTGPRGVESLARKSGHPPITSA